jgi:hypothetical protein
MNCKLRFLQEAPIEKGQYFTQNREKMYLCGSKQTTAQQTPWPR